jgi:hypothetical protein
MHRKEKHMIGEGATTHQISSDAFYSFFLRTLVEPCNRKKTHMKEKHAKGGATVVH